jgi:carboxyl-terminal processing protease
MVTILFHKKQIMRKYLKYILIFTILTSTVFITRGITFSTTDEDDFELSKNLEVFYSLYKELNKYYVDETDPGELMKNGIDEMLKTLDPYTVYYPESRIEDYKLMTTGQYGGIGALIRKKEGNIMITEPYEGYPAHKAGLHAGDFVVKIDGRSVKDISADDIGNFLKGQPGTEVKLTIQRPGVENEFEKTLVREEIQLESVPYYGMIDDKTGYIKLRSFTKKASGDVKNAFNELKDSLGMQSLILDLRGNPGGLLIEAVHIVNIFTEKGQEVVSTKGKLTQWNKTYRGMHDPLDTEIPVVVLVNSGSASASEIVSGAIQDLDRGVILGQRTFGKGLVQTTRDLVYNSKLKVTTAKYYIPSGRCIQALDYSHRNADGSVGKVPDSLITEFKTKNGRLVYDGGGVLPDIKTEAKTYSNLTKALITENLIFEYTTLYCNKYDSIESIDKFSFNEKDYADFKSFLTTKDFKYETKSEEKLKELIKTAKNEKYYAVVEDEIKDLQSKLHQDLEKDLSIFKDEIVELIEQEIISRYYFQKGRIKSQLKTDKDLKKAIEILNNNTAFSSVLDGSYKEETSEDSE